jgi:CRISPR system Cascade subunit CasC
MDRFVQLHMLTFYPPSNLNRDDSGKPKTAVIGGSTRLRVSSQALKRAWRTSNVFAKAVGEGRGQRTQRIGEVVRRHLIDKGMPEAQALGIAREIAEAFGKVKPESEGRPVALTEQLAFISPEERQAAIAFAEARAAGESTAKDKKEIGAHLLRKTDTAADIAMFGRMLADNPDFNREAAVQVAHAFTTHKALVDDDYYTAVDDLKTRDEDAGAGFIGETGFGAGVFYLYVNIDRALLLANLGGDRDMARRAIAGLVAAAATTGPRGKSASFASFARAAYVLAERGDETPRTLASAFVRPQPPGDDQIAGSIAMLTKTRGDLENAYGWTGAAPAVMDVAKGEGKLVDIITYAIDGLEGDRPQDEAPGNGA